jgi:hypothetical protein
MRRHEAWRAVAQLCRHSRPSLARLVRVEATAVKDARIAWIASMQCRMTEPDEGRLAQELGRVIGGALGRGWSGRRSDR